MSTDPNPTPAAQPRSSGPQALLMAGVVIILLALGFIVFLIATGRGTVLAPAPTNTVAEAAPAAAPPAPPPAPAGPPPAMPNRGQLLPSGLRIETIREGRGPLVARTDTPLIRYELRVLGRDGVVESNFDAPQAAPLPLDGVIPGFAEAVTHIRPGGEARFWVPPSIGYGANPPPGGPFGPNDILEFRVRVEGIAPTGARGATRGARASSNPTNAAAEAPIPVPGQ